MLIVIELEHHCENQVSFDFFFFEEKAENGSGRKSIVTIFPTFQFILYQFVKDIDLLNEVNKLTRVFTILGFSLGLMQTSHS